MKIIGLTGGIGSGKSTVSCIFASMGFPVYMADTESKRLTETSSEIRKRLVERFGAHLYYKDGKLNKSLLASYIFNNEDNLHFVNSVIHPFVFENFKLWVAEHKNCSAVIIESAILFESGFYRETDYTVTVSSPLELRIARVIARDVTNREDVERRIQSQLSEEERNRLADRIISNDERHSVLYQIENLIKSLHL
ncbi:MAG: dephospho-CoA kinase [Dysgonamonadaceae bacterium]|jgi:dephospho-CoA kinase|nr:dephospho-CoA kinase [Dysgonamonadaceae bacterium]